MTQQYTPVTWQDETTSQQGTLINAERLNQMQTAHHYADGFEEVDAVPTADPSVAYHKVVYCTADNTFYRWDGTEWTKDIDDETKRLLQEEIARATEAERTIEGYLDAHEANHSNPHVVTKAQVGLGNCDNTADLDKPISTATQAALDGKADKATTLAGYGITDAYTKSQADTLLANKADKADTYTKAQVDGYLGGKVDKLGSSPAGTYRSVTVNAQGQVTAGTNPDTLAGYGITDAYTKTEADTLLATKAPTTALTDGSVTKVGTSNVGDDTKPIKLVGGVPTAVTDTLAKDSAVVHNTGAETVAGVKTFTGSPIVSHDDDNLNLQNPNFTIGTKPSSTKWATLNYTDSANTRHGMIALGTSSVGNSELRFRVYNFDHSANALMGLFATVGGDAYLTAPTRTYNASNTNDVATIGTLDAYTPMVRTTGAQTITGTKTLMDAEFNGLYKHKSITYGSNDNGYIRIYKGKNNTSTGAQMMVGFLSGKGYNANDRNNWALMIFTARTNIGTVEIIPIIQGSYQQAGAYAMTIDTDGYPEVWVHNVLPGTTNHMMAAQVLMETATNGPTDYFDISDGYVMSEADFATAYPNAVYSS